MKTFKPVKSRIFLFERSIEVTDKHFFVSTNPSRISSIPISIKYFSKEKIIVDQTLQQTEKEININSQNNFTFSGYVLDSQTNELVIGASVIIDELNIGTITNSYGFFSITVKEGNYSVKTQNLGYKDDLQIISLNKNIILNIYLTEEVESLDEVIVMENTEDIDIELPVLSLNIISGKTIRQTPVVFGESDILKTIQLLPGVSSAGEGASGFNVRGGAADQNLILFDEAIIYNSSHLFGLFSVFNSDFISLTVATCDLVDFDTFTFISFSVYSISVRLNSFKYSVSSLIIFLFIFI